MTCPKCQGKTIVTRTDQWSGLTVRYRRCIICGHTGVSVESWKPKSRTLTPDMESESSKPLSK